MRQLFAARPTYPMTVIDAKSDAHSLSVQWLTTCTLSTQVPTSTAYGEESNVGISVTE